MGDVVLEARRRRIGRLSWWSILHRLALCVCERFSQATQEVHDENSQEWQAQSVCGLREALFGNGAEGTDSGISRHSTRNGGRMDKIGGRYSPASKAVEIIQVCPQSSRLAVFGGLGMSLQYLPRHARQLGDVHRDKESLVARESRFGCGALSHRRGDWGAARTGA